MQITINAERKKRNHEQLCRQLRVTTTIKLRIQ